MVVDATLPGASKGSQSHPTFWGDVTRRPPADVPRFDPMLPTAELHSAPSAPQ